MRLIGVDGVVLGVEEVETAKTFYRDFGLDAVDHAPNSAEMATQDGTTIALHPQTAQGLPPAVTTGSTVREIIWSVQSQDNVEQAAAELARDRHVAMDGDGTIHALDDDGYGIAIRTERRKAIAPAANRLNIYGAAPNRPINSRIDFFEAIRPASVAHVVLKTPDVLRAQRFYIERLGFRMTDRFSGGHGAFLRSAGSPYHHNLFLIHAPERGLHHIAFAVTDFNDVILGGQALLRKGWDPKMGPGRHVIGSNFFWYFNSPCGGAMELTADIDRADDDWVPGEWEFLPQNTMGYAMDHKALPGNGPIAPRPVST